MKHLSVFKVLLFTLLFAAGAVKTYATGDSVIQFKIFIADSTYVPTVTTSGSYLTLTFSDPTLTSLLSGYHVTQFQNAHALSRHPYLHQFWLVQADHISMMTDMLNYSSTIFPWAKILPQMQWIGTWPPNPNDYSGNHGELDLVNVTSGWAIDTGKPGVVIGEIDSYFDTLNTDLVGKKTPYHIEYPGTYPGFGSVNHGTATAGIMAGRTNNDTFFASMCPGCMLELEQYASSASSDSMLYMSVVHGDRILNASWGSCDTDASYFNDDEMAYDEMYENGTFVVCGAGDGIPSGCASRSSYMYPASWSHNFSVTAVGYDPTPGATVNIKFLHDGDTSAANIGNQFTHNARVDLMAPGYKMQVLSSGSVNTGGYWTETADGTSFSSPMVAGAAGVMLSHVGTIALPIGLFIKANRE